MIEITLMIVAYLLGSIPSGVWIGKAFFQTDIREHGSGNSGTTNTYRILGKSAGTIVLIMDVAKGTAAALLPIWFGLNNPSNDYWIICHHRTCLSYIC